MTDLEERRSRLSKREVCILDGLMKGQSNKVIARECGIADTTVKVHMKSIMRKIRVENRTQAAIWAMENVASAQPACEAIRAEAFAEAAKVVENSCCMDIAARIIPNAGKGGVGLETAREIAQLILKASAVPKP